MILNTGNGMYYKESALSDFCGIGIQIHGLAFPG